MNLEEKVFLFEDDPKEPSMNLAINEACRLGVHAGRYGVIGRVYTHEKGVILGNSESFVDVNLDYCRSEDYEIVRRVSGGSAIVVNPEIVLCYSLFFHSNNNSIKDDIGEIYRSITVPLAKAMGEKFSVEGTYYLRVRTNDGKIPIAGHAIRKDANGVYQFDGVINKTEFDMDTLSRAINLRTLHTFNGQQYIKSNGVIYTLKGKVSEIQINRDAPLRIEREELSKIIGLNRLSISDKTFANHFYEVIRDTFGEISKVKEIDFSQRELEKLQDQILEEKGGGSLGGQGHCFVDLAEPEPVVHYG